MERFSLRKLPTLKLNEDVLELAENVSEEVLEHYAATEEHPTILNLGLKIATKRMELFAREGKTVMENEQDYDNYLSTLTQADLLEINLATDAAEYAAAKDAETGGFMH